MTLRQWLATAGVVIIGGAGVLVQVLRGNPEETRVPASCQVRDLCQATRADGGLSRRYGTILTCALSFEADAGQVLLTRFPRRAGRDCYELAGPPDEACAVADAGGDLCADDGGTAFSARADQDRCGCRDRAGMCRTPNPDGGLGLPMDFNRNYQQPFTGAGCVRKSCNETAGEKGLSMPEECL